MSDKKQFLKDTLSAISNGEPTDLNINIFPYYYIFDNLLNSKIGCSKDIRDIVFKTIDIKEIFDTLELDAGYFDDLSESNKD
jgi:hypothetical protein